MKRIIILASLMLMIVLSLCGCSSSDDEGFAIYLPAGGILASELPALSDIDIEDTPLLSEEDIISYSSETHEMQLAQEAYDRIRELDIAVSGNVFVVCVDEKPVYAGTFMVMWSSQLPFGVSIMQPLSEENHEIRIEYHSAPPGQAVVDDPRSDPRIIDALESAGKLD